MPRKYGNLKARILKLLDENPGQSVKELARQLKVKRNFVAGYLQSIEDQGYVRSKRTGPANVYFNSVSIKNAREGNYHAERGGNQSTIG